MGRQKDWRFRLRKKGKRNLSWLVASRIIEKATGRAQSNAHKCFIDITQKLVAKSLLWQGSLQIMCVSLLMHSPQWLGTTERTSILEEKWACCESKCWLVKTQQEEVHRWKWVLHHVEQLVFCLFIHSMQKYWSWRKRGVYVLSLIRFSAPKHNTSLPTAQGKSKALRKLKTLCKPVMYLLCDRPVYWQAFSTVR